MEKSINFKCSLSKIQSVKSARACPICTNCGSKKFERLDSEGVKVRCVKCNKEYKI